MKSILYALFLYLITSTPANCVIQMSRIKLYIYKLKKRMESLSKKKSFCFLLHERKI